MERFAMLVVIAAACSAPAGPRVAVLPETWASTRPEQAEPAAPRIAQALRAHQLAPVADEVSARALASEASSGASPPSSPCIDDLVCLRRVGEKLGATKLITLKMAELGETVAVQLTVVDVRRAAREATLREVVNPNEATRLAATLDDMGARVARQNAPEQRSQRWLWIGAGGVIVAATIATILIVTAGGDDPDTTIVPP